MDDAPIVVAYLARREEGRASLTRFLDSYRRHPAGCPHQLAILQKGFMGIHACEWGFWKNLLVGFPHVVHPVPQEGFDLGAYRAYLASVPRRSVLFLNSHSEILVNDWLDLMVRHLRPGCLIGATGSWESHRSNLLEPYAPQGDTVIQRLRRSATAFRASKRADLSDHPPFPNPAIRSNAFLVPPDLHRFLAEWPIPHTKASCHALESGRAGLSRAVVGNGGTLLLAAADGNAYAPLTWPAAGVFRSLGQRNLIIADNQTRRYDSATTDEKRGLGWSAWRSFHVID